MPVVQKFNTTFSYHVQNRIQFFSPLLSLRYTNGLQKGLAVYILV